MYQVIARTWRPQRFSEVIGQRHVTQTLQNAIRLNRIGHGYIFSGQRGVGKTTLARLLAKALNCQRGPSPEPCGECDSCREITAGRAVDVIEIDAASNRGIDAVRELRENARYAPARDRYKIFIIDEAHQITPEGFNALLKTLEEPPAHVLFLLATTEVHQFPETILSRCQHFSLHALNFSEILGHLEKVCEGEKVEADAEALAVLAKSGEGSLRDALSRLEQAIGAFGERLEGAAVRRFLGEAPSSLIEQVLHAIKDQKREPMLEVVEKLVEDGYQLSHFCSQLVRTMRNLLVVRVAGPEPRLLESSAEESQRLVALAEGFSEESLMRGLAILLQLHQELRYSMEPRFQMELGLLKLVDAERLVSIEDLLAKMESRPEGMPEQTLPAGYRSGSPSPAPSAPSHPGGAAKAPEAPLASEQIRRSAKPTPWEQDSIRKKQTYDPSSYRSGSPEEALGPQRGESSLTGGKGSAVEVTIGEVAPAATEVVPIPLMGAEISSQEEGWIQEILRRLEEQAKPILASLLSNARGWEFGESEVRIQLADDALAKVVLDPDRQWLESLLTAIFGRKMKVSFSGDHRNQPREQIRRGGGVGKGDAGPERAGSVESRVRQDPAILEFEKLFGKRVTGIRNWKE